MAIGVEMLHVRTGQGDDLALARRLIIGAAR
jgi:hypothetical protein